MKNMLIASLLITFVVTSIKAQQFKIISENDKFILVDQNGKNMLNESFSAISPCKNAAQFYICSNDKIYLVNAATKAKHELGEYFEDLKIESDTCKFANNYPVRIKTKKGIGLIAFPDKKLLEANYTKIYPSDRAREFVLLLKNKKYTFYYPATGKYSPEFTEIGPNDLYIDNELSYLPSDAVLAVKINENINLMKSDGAPFSVEKFPFKEFKLDEIDVPILSRQGFKYGYIDKNCHTVIPFKYDDGEWFSANYDAIVKENGKYGTIDAQGVVKIPIIYDKLAYGKNELLEATIKTITIQLFPDGNPANILTPTLNNDKFGYTGEDETQIKINYQFDGAEAFSDGLAAVNRGGKFNQELNMVKGGNWGFISPTGDLIIDYKFEEVKTFNFGFAAAKQNGKWGYIDFTGKYKIENLFDSVQPFDAGKAEVYKSGNIFSIDTKGRTEVVFIKPEKGNFKDERNGVIYKTVKIGDQVWLAQNLDYKTDGSYYYLNNDSIGKIHGRLYTWEAATLACPNGWHLPTDDDWKILEKTLGMPDEQLNSTDYTRGSKEPEMLKKGGSTGFDILMDGFLHGYDKQFYKLDEVCIIWTATENGTDYAWTRSFFPDSEMLNRNDNTYKKYALPVRCVKNEE